MPSNTKGDDRIRLFRDIQANQKLVLLSLPMQNQDEKCPKKTEESIFIFNLFKYHMKSFVFDKQSSAFECIIVQNK